MTSEETQEPSEQTPEEGAESDRAPDRLGKLLGDLTTTERPTAEQVGQLATALAASARAAGTRAVASGRWLAEVTLEAAVRLPIRDRATLVSHHNGLDGDTLAAALVRNASLRSAAVGAGFGALAAASVLTPGTWATLPIELLAETLAIVAIELKLIGELHAAAARPIEGSAPERAALLASAWAEGRGISTTRILYGFRVLDVASRQARQRLVEQLRRRLLGRVGRNIATLVPFLVGAAAGAQMNRRSTQKLGTAVAADLGLRA